MPGAAPASCCSLPFPDPGVCAWQAQASAEHGTLLPRETHKAALQECLPDSFRLRCPLSAGAQAQASAQQGMPLPRERHKAAYQAALVERFRHLPEVKRIERHRHLPAALYKARPWPGFFPVLRTLAPAVCRPVMPGFRDIRAWTRHTHVFDCKLCADKSL